MAPSAPTCLSTGGGLYTNGKPYIILFWSQNEAGNDGTFAKLEYCTGAACSGFAQFDTAPVESYSTGYGYDPCTAGYALRSKYEWGATVQLSYNTLYRFRIRNEQNGEFSSYSNIAEFTTNADPGIPDEGADTSPPLAPTNLSLSGSTNTINLSWTDNSDNENGFAIERRSVSGSFWTNWQSVGTVAANTTTYADTGLLYETVYAYRIRAYNDYGYSGYSNEAQLETEALVVSGLGAPTLSSAELEFIGFEPQVKLIWVDNSTTETAFLIERSTNFGTFQVIFTSAPDTLTYTDTNVESGSTYIYRLRAFRSSDGAYSPYSNTKTVKVQTFIPPGTGAARHFDGSAAPVPNDYMFSPNTSATYLHFSWGAWVKRDGTGTRNGITGRLFGSGNGWSIYIDELDNFCFRMDGTTTSVASPDLSNWTYLAVTFDPDLGSNEVKFYAGDSTATIDLIGQANNSALGFAELSTYGAAVGWVTFGELADGGAINAWNGSIDQVGWWATTLTLSDIKAASVCAALVQPAFIAFVIPITGEDPEPAAVVGGGYSVTFGVVGTTVVPGGCGASSGGVVVVPGSYGIGHCPSGTPSTYGVIRDNQITNNGLANINPLIYTLPGITIDNPGTENIYIRRGVTIYEN